MNTKYVLKLCDEMIDLANQIKTYVTSFENSTRLEFDLDAIYALYPRKIGKTPGLRKLKKEIKTKGDYDDAITAATRFAEFIKGRDPQYIPYFSTWANQWRDWINPDPAQLASGYYAQFLRLSNAEAHGSDGTEN
jgi:hypothetical protein